MGLKAFYRRIRIARSAANDAGRARRRVAWLAASALLFQLFITQVHAFMGGETWDLNNGAPAATAPASGQAAADAPVICHFDPGAPAGSPAPATDRSTAQHPECPIYQSLPMVSAALATAFIELPAPPFFGDRIETAAPASSPRSAPLGLRPEPRAPPVPA